ncbi:PilZ domain-containing protein [Reinekea marina]|uniref:PilZ domain-containing protein n=1 Tax=Reinekea marina TaxID=1310421 RepID=A0ABV7WMC8_9GAMM|nr:PilZ domain-containing protein [Reinekea marina]MDN3649379.1 PilZ domain-containing protein [Reinekea marina]
MSQEKRNHPRTSVKMTIKLTLDSGDQIIGETWDISDGGIAFSNEQFDSEFWHKGMLVTGQLQDLPIEAPILELHVAWVGQNSMGLAIVPR